VQQDIGPIKLSSVYAATDINLSDLRVYDRQQVEQTINAGSLADAQAIVERLKGAVVE
jgi:protein phosphatase